MHVFDRLTIIGMSLEGPTLTLNYAAAAAGVVAAQFAPHLALNTWSCRCQGTA